MKCIDFLMSEACVVSFILTMYFLVLCQFTMFIKGQGRVTPGLNYVFAVIQ